MRKRALLYHIQRRESSTNFFEKAGRDWVRTWTEGLTPWEVNSTNPIIEEVDTLLSKTTTKSTSASDSKDRIMKTFIPGCGSGYDAIYLHKTGKYSPILGMDLSPMAVEKARLNLKEATIIKDKRGVEEKKMNDNRTEIRFEVGDVLQHKPSEPYDLIYDYLFLQALEPSLREKMVSKLKSLLRPNAGILATVIFPLKPDVTQSDSTVTKPMETSNTSTGPPYESSLAEHRLMLENRHGFQLVGKPTLLQSSIKPRRGRELLAFWRPS